MSFVEGILSVTLREYISGHTRWGSMASVQHISGQILIALCLTPISTFGQTPCEHGTDSLVLDSGPARATLSNNGNMFREPILRGAPRFWRKREPKRLPP